VPLTARDQTERLCPAETLYTVENPPPGYSPTGRLIGPVQGDTLWAIEPEDGRRYPDERIPTCGFGLSCTLSPDRRTILAESDTTIYLVNPDGTDSRVLFDDDPPEEIYDWPDEIYWSGANTLEWEVYEQVEGQYEGYRDYQYFRDILGVFPDPPLWWPRFRINGRQAYLIQRQPGGALAVAYTTFSTGYSPGYEYYLYNTETGEAEYFVRMADYPARDLRVAWHPLGDRLFYTFSERDTDWYQYTPATGEHQWLGRRFGGSWSSDGRYRMFATDSRSQPIGLWDSQTGLLRTYCLPETGARLYEGNFYWSPDSRYVALQTALPAEEDNDDIGQRVLVLDIETGSVTSVSFGGGALFMWAEDPAEGA
jgi:WD40 repeat protein